jgi:hypothetical protein
MHEKKRLMQISRACGLILIACLGTIPLSAAPTIFTIDNTRSQITLSGDVVGETLSAQASGSLTTTCSGFILANVTQSTIQFPGQSQLIADTNGVWQPAVGGGSGSAIADFGGKVTVPFVGAAYAAARNTELDLTGPLLPLSGGSFDSSALIFSYSTNVIPTLDPTLDYNAGFLGSGSKTLSAYSTNNILDGATLTSSGSIQTLAISINAQFTFSLLSSGDTTLNIVGQLVATSSPAPLIDTIVLSKSTVVLTVQNATGQSQLQSSPDLIAWTPAASIVTTNGTTLTYTVPISGGNQFYRVQK